MNLRIPKQLVLTPRLTSEVFGPPCPGVDIYDDRNRKIGSFKPTGSSSTERVRCVRKNFDKKDCSQSVFLFDVACDDRRLLNCVIFRQERYDQIRGQLASMLRSIPSKSTSADSKARWALLVNKLITEAVDCANSEPFFRRSALSGYGVRQPDPEWGTTYQRPEQELSSWIEWARTSGGASSACATGCIIVPIAPNLGRRAIPGRGGTYSPTQLYDFEPNLNASTIKFPDGKLSKKMNSFSYLENVFKFFPDRGFYPAPGAHSLQRFVMGGEFIIDHARIWAEEIVNRPIEHYVLIGLHNWLVHVLQYQDAGLLGLSASEVRELQQAAFKASETYQETKRRRGTIGGIIQGVGGILIATGNVYAIIVGVVLIIVGLFVSLTRPASMTQYAGIDACPRLPFIRQPMRTECSLSGQISEDALRRWQSTTLPNLQRATGIRFSNVLPPLSDREILHDPPKGSDLGKILLTAGGALAVGGIGYALLRKKP